MKRTYQPSKIVRKRRHGFRARMATVGGRRVINARRAKGRARLSAYKARIPRDPPKTIKNRSDFLAATAKSKKFVTGTFILQMMSAVIIRRQPPRFGFTVTKKMGNAVIRNRIKRRLREAVRQAASSARAARPRLCAHFAAQGTRLPFSDLLRDMEFAFSRIPSMKNTQTAKPVK